MVQLVVISGFSPYGVGQTITDPATVAAILAGPNAVRVVVVADGSPTSPAVDLSGLTTAQINAIDLLIAAAFEAAGVPAGSTIPSLIGQALTGSGNGSPAPTLAALSLSTLSAVAGSPFSATITGQTAGSTVAATADDGTALTVTGGQVSGTFAAAGSPTVTLTETLAGATGSPKSTQLVISVTTVAVDRTATTDLSNPDRGLNPLI